MQVAKHRPKKVSKHRHRRIDPTEEYVNGLFPEIVEFRDDDDDDEEEAENGPNGHTAARREGQCQRFRNSPINRPLLFSSHGDEREPSDPRGERRRATDMRLALHITRFFMFCILEVTAFCMPECVREDEGNTHREYIHNYFHGSVTPPFCRSDKRSFTAG